ncbi:putative peptidase S49, ClpP/crotonase-like domain superfamily [Helianthus anomalus]
MPKQHIFCIYHLNVKRFQVRSMLKTRLGIAEKKKLPLIDYKKYSRIRKWSVGLSGGKDRIAVIRASGSISRVGGSLFSPSSGIIAEKFIKKISKVRGMYNIDLANGSGWVRSWVKMGSGQNGFGSKRVNYKKGLFWFGSKRVRVETGPGQNGSGSERVSGRNGPYTITSYNSFYQDSKKYKAVIIRIDSPGGDVLASDLMWREIKVLAESKPVVASMVDVAASGGYYMAMAANTIVSENLTLTGSIGLFTAKFNFGKLHEKIGFNKEIVSTGRYAELFSADRSFRPDEEKLFAERAQNMYKQFRDKAACSRSMSVDTMEEIAQGRVWTGKDASYRGLVDAIGGFSRAVNIPQKKEVDEFEMIYKKIII